MKQHTADVHANIYQSAIQASTHASGKEKKIMHQRGRGRENQIKTAPTEQSCSIPVRPASTGAEVDQEPGRAHDSAGWLYMSWTSVDGVLAVVVLPSLQPPSQDPATAGLPGILALSRRVCSARGAGGAAPADAARAQGRGRPQVPRGAVTDPRPRAP
ncbi:hypothetical protein C2845_PM01G41680 [Panicum miliaceum]|uniref:Uncharacterized protein n=1 Tax=Panicum miliaceum TaxID=4540 RepID=A0A3L6TMZ9_PANMI|nr:hypothetical protein C2845_PM01G41680 [Panicum miliaceum]